MPDENRYYKFLLSRAKKLVKAKSSPNSPAEDVSAIQIENKFSKTDFLGRTREKVKNKSNKKRVIDISAM